MPQLRQNILLKDWIIFSTERAKRPEQLKENKDLNVVLPEYDENCPFCPGNEEKFGNTIDVYRIDSNNNWQIRIIPNKYPAVIPNENLSNKNTMGNFRWMDGIGNHEVIIETPKHNLTIATMDIENIKNILIAYKERNIQLRKLPYIESIITFRNHGTKAGASLIHPHSQIIALPVIPRDIISRVNESIRYHEEHRECIFCKVLQSELDSKERIILETKYFVAFVPYAAYSPFHIWIFPKIHKYSYHLIDDCEINDLAYVLKTILRKLYYGLNDPDYNYIIRSAPKGFHIFHWYLTIVPRLTRSAGFELGTGTFINPCLPEENAEYLRNINVD